MKRIFFDTEFTGLHAGTTLISIGCISETGEEFYAEANDYAVDQVNDWLRQNVVAHLGTDGFQGTRAEIAVELTKWLERVASGGQVEMWSDVLAYDWMLFCELWGGATNLPKCVYYIPFDLGTLLKVAGIDPDISREDFADMKTGALKHNALWDARVIRECVAVARRHVEAAMQQGKLDLTDNSSQRGER